MYQKLKKFIMNKRKREAEERAQDDYYKRLRKEREERKRQTKLFAESLENTRREIIETRKRVEALKAERNALFTRLKQLSQATAMREKAKRASLLLVPEMQPRTFGPTYPADTLSSAGTLQLGKAPAQFQVRGLGSNSMVIRSA
nr:unnamed protein product [Spirometra erinaceieuropaei]